MPAVQSHATRQTRIGADVLPLRVFTSESWAAEALSDPLALLNDHAHLEKKAAANVLELLNRWPDPHPPENWVKAMTTVARDEVEHLALVTRLLARRGGRFAKHHKNPYANALRDLVRLGAGNLELMDRLMVSALIEARSCERFHLLDATDEKHGCDPALRRVYEGLWASEHGHYRIFLDLATHVLGEQRRDAVAIVERRWGEMLDAESEIIRRQSPGPRMHGWPAE